MPTVQSTSINTIEDGSSLVITKPAGTTDGDLLIAVVGGHGTVSSAPSGWTLVEGETGNHSGTVYLYRKAASSEGSDYTWSFNANQATGVILRIDGHNASSPIGAQNSTAKSVVNNGSDPSFNIGITPPVGNSLLIIAVANDEGGSGGVTSYSIATDNPTWTERLDVSYPVGSPTKGLACATASRLESSATGDVSITSDNPSTADWLGILVSITPDPNSSFSAGVINLTATLNNPTSITGTSQTNVNTINTTVSVQNPTVAITETKWKNVNKNSSTWNNQSKS